MKRIAFFIIVFFVFTGSDTQAGIVIQSHTDAGPWLKSSAIYPLKGQKVLLRVREISGAAIRWYRIFPDISKFYKNANHPWEKNPYQWVGFDKIDYHREELALFRDQWEIEPFKTVRSTDPSDIWDNALSWFGFSESADSRYCQKDVGSFWFQAVTEKNGKTEKTPGIEDSGERGLSPKVFRISLRDSEGYVGYLTSFFNVPGLFGSVPYQSNNHIGADCADILIAAYGKWKGKRIKKNYNVAMLVNKFPVIAEFEMAEGSPDKAVQWGKIRSGDFIAVRYRPGSQYQHIGALFRDANENGILDGRDLVLHAGPDPLHFSYLEEGGFDGHVRILRP